MPTAFAVFDVIAAPVRRRILDAVRGGGPSVGELLDAVGMHQPSSTLRRTAPAHAHEEAAMTDDPHPSDDSTAGSVSHLLRVWCFNVSRDGFGAGVGQTLERPFGHANPAEIFAWAGAPASWPNRSEPGGTRGLDDYFTRDCARNIGAEIMGRNRFGPQRGSWANRAWTGWWGETPPFHTPVFVLTHHPRPSFTLADTTFHVLEATPHDALRQGEGRGDRQGRAPRRRGPLPSALGTVL